MSYSGCSPASRAKLLATLSPLEGVWPGRSAGAPSLPLHAQCGGLEGRRDKRLGFVSLLLYTPRANSSQLSGQRTSHLPWAHCPGRAPTSPAAPASPGAHYCGRADTA